MLIDDSETDNFIHCRHLDKMEIAERIVVRNDGRQGLEYLAAARPEERPDLLFLDINMPVMDGWEFLEAYQEIPEERRAKVTIVMLTSSVGASDYSRAQSYAIIDGHEAKPLTQDKVSSLLNQYFPN